MVVLIIEVEAVASGMLMIVLVCGEDESGDGSDGGFEWCSNGYSFLFGSKGDGS